MSNHPTENKYILENDDESKRLANQHEVVKAAMRGKLLRVPVNFTGESVNVLDSGTADGTWLRDLISTYQVPESTSHRFTGSDITVTEFPTSPPSHTSYIYQDITQPWSRDLHASFDLVHQRLTLPGAGSRQRLAVQQLAALVKPGGWIQLIEAENIEHEGDGPCMRDFIAFKRIVFTGMGANLRLTKDIPIWLEDVGFQDVKSELVWMELGAANKNEEIGARGVYSTTRLVEMLGPFARGLGEKVAFAESGSTLNEFAGNLGRELKRVGGRLPMRVLWAQRPLVL